MGAQARLRNGFVRRIAIITVVLGAMAALAGCIPVTPPGTVASVPPATGAITSSVMLGNCNNAAGNFTGAHTVSSGAGTLYFKSFVCWGGDSVVTGIAIIDSYCQRPDKTFTTPPSGNQEGRGIPGAWVTTVRVGCNFTGGYVGEIHGHRINGALQSHVYCTPNFSFCPTDANSHSLDSATPPNTTPPSAPQDRYISGRRVGSTDLAVTQAAVKVDGHPATNTDGTGGFRYDLLDGVRDSHTVTVDVPSGWSVGYTICNKKTDCHNKAQTPGNSAPVQPDLDEWWDIQWHFTAVGSVSGSKLIGNDTNSRIERDIAAQNVLMDGKIFATGSNDYSSTVPAGLHTFSVSVPAGWSVGYTMCAQGLSNCHGNTPTPGSSVQVNVPKGQNVSLVWHFTPPPPIACNKPAKTFGGNELRPNECLRVNQGRLSTDGRYMLILQGDGNLVIYATATMTPLWDSGTTDYQNVGTTAVLQADGNFVIYAAGAPVWATDTFDTASLALVLQTNGDLQLVRGFAPYTMLWHSMG